MTQLEFYKSFQFVFELLLAETMFMYRLRRRPKFVLRLIIALPLLFLFSWLIPAIPNAFYCSFMFLVIFVLTVAAGIFLFKATPLTVAFCGIAGYTTQHLAYEVYMLLLNAMGANADTPMGFYGSEYIGMFSNLFLTACYAFVYVLTYFICFYLFSEKLVGVETVKVRNTFIFVFSVFIFAIDILLNSVVVYYAVNDGNVLYYIVEVYNVISCLVALYLQFSAMSEGRLRETLDTVQRLWHQAKEQYAVSKTNVEMINMRCHDLKHLMNMLSGEKGVSSAILSDIENRISVYDAEARTGNTALDIILTEKGLICNKNDIKLSCIADGSRLGFMQEEDIYVLFGNILDNAIEACLKLDPSKRIISLHVSKVGGLIVIKETNYCEGEVAFEDELPVTTKENKKYHGFGVKSIKYICSLYNGDLSIKVQDDMFVVNIMFSETDSKDI